MHIGGLQKNSFIDYPERISAVLFLYGCNFRCPYCHNPELVNGEMEPLDPEQVMAFLKDRRGFLDGVVISGGEPALQKDLPGLCERIKEMGFPVKLDTNGSRPDVVRELIQQGLVDYLAMDIKTAPERYPETVWKEGDPERIRESIRLILDAGLPHEFRTTCVKPLVDEQIVREIGELIRGAEVYALQQCLTEKVLVPGFFHDPDLQRYSDDEMKHFQTIAAPCVRSCVVR